MNNEIDNELVEVPYIPESNKKVELTEPEFNRLHEEIHKLVKHIYNTVKASLKYRDSGLVSLARQELELAGLFDEDSDYGGMLGEAVLELVQLFSMQGHNGFSAGLVMELFGLVANYKPLTETDHSINMDVSEYYDNPPGTNLQDKRDCAWFSDDSGKTWYNVNDKDVVV